MAIVLIPQREALRRVGRSRWWLRDELTREASSFPRPVRHGRRVMFIESEVEAYLAALVSARDGERRAA